MTGPALSYADFQQDLSPQVFARSSGSLDRLHKDFQSGALERRIGRENVNDREMVEAETPSYAQRALGGIASLAKDIPFAEMAQAGARSVVRDQPYEEALSDIRGAEEAAPTSVRTLNRLVGIAPVTAMLPGSNMAKGAIFGALHGAGTADPEADRATETIKQGVIGGVLGATGDVASDVAKRGGRFLAGRLAKEKATAQAVGNALKQAVGKWRAAKDAVRGMLRRTKPAGGVEVPAPPRQPMVPEEAFVPEGGVEGTPLPNANLTEALTDLSARARSQLPLAERAGNQWGDAEIAMGLDQPPPDLGDLLRRSLDIARKTGKLPKGPR